MEKDWPNKNDREKWEIEEFIRQYPNLSHGCNFKILEIRDKPDVFVEDVKTGEIFGVELTSVYLDDRSVPDLHKKVHDGTEMIPLDQKKISKYMGRIREAIISKINKSKDVDFDKSYRLILSIYINEYDSIFMGRNRWEEFYENNRDILEDIKPFTEIVFWPLPNGDIYSIKQ